MTDSTAEGTYTLVLELAESATVEVGALGAREFAAGGYAYTGSAFGPGGFARVERHRELCAGERDARHWHVDYLLGHPDATVEAVVRTPDEDVECGVSRALVGADDGVGREDGDSAGRGDGTSAGREDGDGTDCGDADGAGERERVPEFGASDCDCESHLVYEADGESLRHAVERVHRTYR
ncbi:GIY-YIG nuclease family protein [Halosimplex amylolyticum]|uniref:GIY-YIG nuclease family protein n=1 Tax=Halosimplex amylolyticum TaxID=3396616 RepID=UPI003F557085